MRSRRVALFASVLAVAASVEANQIILSDFNGTGFDFTYGQWTPSDITTGSTFVTISAVGLQGGAGVNFTPHVTLNNYHTQLVVTARIGRDNESSQFNIVLIDNDPGGVEFFVYFFPATLFNNSTFTTITRSLLDPPDYYAVQSGTPDGTLNLDASGGMPNFQIQGNYANTTDRFHWEFDIVYIVPEPSTIGLALVGLGLIGLRVVRRRSM